MPKVYNFRTDQVPRGAVYVGRGSPFGNPFKIGIYGDRDKVCDLYENYVRDNPDLLARIKKELRGKDLVCWCKPKRCHADFLLQVANEDEEEA